MKIADILRHKAPHGTGGAGGTGGTGGTVVTIGPAERVPALLAALAEHNIGALVVAEDGAVRGIVSERDIVRRLAAAGAQVLESTVADLMTPDVVTCGSGDPVDTIAATMTERRIRHMPVVDDGALVGIVSIGDVVLSRMRQLENDRGQLEHYIAG